MPVWVAFIPSPRQAGGMVRNDRQVPGRGQSVGTTTPELGVRIATTRARTVTVAAMVLTPPTDECGDRVARRTRTRAVHGRRRPWPGCGPGVQPPGHGRLPGGSAVRYVARPRSRPSGPVSSPVW